MLMHAESQGISKSQCLYSQGSTLRLGLVTDTRDHVGAKFCALVCIFSAWLDYARESTGVGWLRPLKQRSSRAQSRGAVALLFCTTVGLDVKTLKRKKT